MTGLEICRECVITRAKDFAAEYMPDAKLAKKFLDDVIPNITALATGETFYEMDDYWTKKAQQLLGVNDLYKDKKEVFQKAFFSIKDEIEATLDESEDVLFDAFRLAAAGNIIDFTCVSGIVIENAKAVINKVKNSPIDKTLYNRFIGEIKNASRFVYLLDNVGECVFDMIYIKKLKAAFPNLSVTVVAKSEPVSSDATIRDAIETGIGEYAQIIGNNNNSYNAFAQSKGRLKEAIDEADVLLAKGMANFEWFVGSDKNMYYLFLCKCKKMYSEVLGFNMNQLYFIADKGFDNSKYVRGNWKSEVVISK